MILYQIYKNLIESDADSTIMRFLQITCEFVDKHGAGV